MSETTVPFAPADPSRLMTTVEVVVDGEIVTADGRTIGWVVRRWVGLRRRWVGYGLYKPHAATEPHRGRMAAACALAKLTATAR